MVKKQLMMVVECNRAGLSEPYPSYGFLGVKPLELNCADDFGLRKRVEMNECTGC